MVLKLQAGMSPQILLDVILRRMYSRVAWSVFHFIPNGKGVGDYAFTVMNPDSYGLNYGERHPVYNIYALAKLFSKDKGLDHYLEGIFSHALCDCYAHEHFSGIESPLNEAVPHNSFTKDIEAWKKRHGIKTNILSKFLSKCIGGVSNYIGHGAVGNIVDWHGNIEFELINQGFTVKRDNTEHLAKAVVRNVYFSRGRKLDIEQAKLLVLNGEACRARIRRNGELKMDRGNKELSASFNSFDTILPDKVDRENFVQAVEVWRESFEEILGKNLNWTD